MSEQSKLMALGGFLTALILDVTEFRKARARDKDAKFDWFMAALRWVAGAVAGATAGQVTG